ncbi:MAG: VOC family protein [Bacteroidetes bacterium]|nr:VOC family protein [Bacteroidota bacterium]
MAKLPMIILYVANQESSRDFYSTVLQQQPSLDVPGMTEFFLADNLKLGLMPEKGIAKILVPFTPHPELGNRIPRCELYLFVENPEEALARAVKAGAKEISKAEARDWGDLVAYCADPDGHIIAFAK